jgi:hypothetical protein
MPTIREHTKRRWRCDTSFSTLGASWIGNRKLSNSWFLTNSPARRNISLNEFTWLRTRWIVTMISQSKMSIVEHYVFICTSKSLSKTYNWAEQCNTRWHIVPWTWNVCTPFRAFAICSKIRAFFIRGAPVDVNEKTLLWDLTLTNTNLFEILRGIIWRCKHNFCATPANVCCLISPFNNLAKLAHSAGCSWWWWTCAWKASRPPISLSTYRSVRSILDALWKVAFISRAWMPSSGITSAVLSARRRGYCSRISSASSVLNSRRVWTSDCRRCSGLNGDTALRVLVYLLVRSASHSSREVKYFSSVSTKELAYLRLDVVKLFVRRVPNTFIIVAASGHWKWQYCHTGILSHWLSFILEWSIFYSCFCSVLHCYHIGILCYYIMCSCIRIRVFITVDAVY